MEKRYTCANIKGKKAVVGILMYIFFFPAPYPNP
jgi:hypothetical protein